MNNTLENRHRTPASASTSHRPQNPLKQQRDTRASRRYRKTTATTRNDFLFPDTKTHKTKTKKVFSSRSFRKDTKCYSKLLQEKTKKEEEQQQKQRQVGTSLRMYKFTTPNRISKTTSDSHLCMKEEEEEVVVVLLLLLFILKLHSSLRFSPRSQPCQKVKNMKKAVEEHERNTRPQ